MYYLLYADGYEMPSKVAIDPGEPSLGRIKVDSVAPPRSLTSIKRYIARIERNPALSYADLFADTSCYTPLKEAQTSIFRTDGPGLSPNEPMAVVQVENPSIPEGKYVIKNQATDFHWSAGYSPIRTVHFYSTTTVRAKDKASNHTQVNNHSPII